MLLLAGILSSQLPTILEPIVVFLANFSQRVNARRIVGRRRALSVSVRVLAIRRSVHPPASHGVAGRSQFGLALRQVKLLVVLVGRAWCRDLTSQ